MDVVLTFLGGISILIGVLVALAGWDRKRQHAAVEATLLKTGLIRYERDPEGRLRPTWPNGFDNLPDALDGIYTRIRSLEGNPPETDVDTP